MVNDGTSVVASDAPATLHGTVAARLVGRARRQSYFVGRVAAQLLDGRHMEFWRVVGVEAAHGDVVRVAPSDELAQALSGV